MPVVEIDEGIERELLPPGDHILILKAIKLKETDVPLKYRKEGEPTTRDCFIWEFESESGGKLSCFSGTKYGNEKANFTTLLNRMVPGMNKEKAKGFNTDTLIGRKFQAVVETRTSEDGKTEYSAIAFLRPVNAALGNGNTASNGHADAPPIEKPAASPANDLARQTALWRTLTGAGFGFDKDATIAMIKDRGATAEGLALLESAAKDVSGMELSIKSVEAFTEAIDDGSIGSPFAA